MEKKKRKVVLFFWWVLLVLVVASVAVVRWQQTLTSNVVKVSSYALLLRDSKTGEPATSLEFNPAVVDWGGGTWAKVNFTTVETREVWVSWNYSGLPSGWTLQAYWCDKSNGWSIDPNTKWLPETESKSTSGLQGYDGIMVWHLVCVNATTDVAELTVTVRTHDSDITIYAL